MHVLYQITFYQVGNGKLLSAFLKSEEPYPGLFLGEIFNSKDFPGLEAFSPCLRIVYIRQLISTFGRGAIHHQWLVFTQDYSQLRSEVPVHDLGNLTNQEMMGDM